MTAALILASSSPFRRMLMENAGLEFSAIAAQLDERAIEAPLERAGVGPAEVAIVLARAKALDVSEKNPGALVVGSDQTMSLGDRVYHKPKDLDEARTHLVSLSGRTHRLNSAIALAVDGELRWQHVAHADLTMRDLSPAFIDHYLSRTGEKTLKSVGAYQLEGEGIQLFSAIAGDYFTILGLPMLPLLNKLRELGVVHG